ncbi:MAG: Hsp20/alpha crystallin family protein [bacterium]|nr:Hsp20/alpha crystallin family protein [bacterium]
MRTVKKWEPLGEIDALRTQVDRMFDQLFGRFGRTWPTFGLKGLFLPPTEVYETETDVVVKVELPGLDPKDVTVEISEDCVQISGEQKLSKDIQEDSYFQSERHYGTFERQIPLPNLIKDQEAKATFKHGMLTIQAPLAQVVRKPKVHKVSILTE